MHQCEAQKAVVANLKMDRVIVGYTNPLDIVLEGYKCSALEVTTNNGSIDKGEDDCNYNYIPEREGEAKIIISIKGKVVSTKYFRARYIEMLPFATLCGRERGVVKIDSNGIVSHYTGDLEGCSQLDADIHFTGDWDAGFRIKNYSVSILKERDTTFTQKDIIGNLFPKNLKQQFKSIGQDSKLIFYGITAQGPDKRILELSPIEFTIIKE